MLGRSTFSISPDGKTLAFFAVRSDGIQHIWVQRIGELEAKLLPDTETPPEAASPIWSPDSKTIAFHANGKLNKINERRHATGNLRRLHFRLQRFVEP